MASEQTGVDDIVKFQRFIYFGSEDGIYFPGERSYGRENSQLIARLISHGQGEQIISDIVKFCNSSQQVKHLSPIFALASCARSSDVKIKQAAYKALPSVCKNSPQLFAFVQYSQILCADNSKVEDGKRQRPTGWGRAQRTAISAWYCDKDPIALTEDLTRFKQRNGWSHVDLLRLCHVKAKQDATAAVLKYVVKGLKEVEKSFSVLEASGVLKDVLKYLLAVDTVKHSSDEQQVARLVEEFRLSLQHVPTNLSKSKEVWLSLLLTLPLTEVLSSLGKLASLALLTPDSEVTKRVLERMKDEKSLTQSGLHPFNILVAWKVYESGRGEKGKLKWLPIPVLQQCLNDIFYRSFKNVKPSKKRFVLGISITGSMALRGLNGTPAVSAAVAAATMALVTARTESDHQLMVFSSEFQQVPLHKEMELLDICRAMSAESSKIPIGASNVNLPITWACKEKRNVDVFIIYTDAQVSSGSTTPLEALTEYRKKVNPKAKLILCGMAPSTMLLGAANVRGVLNIVNFDPSAPTAIENFIAADL